MDVLTDLTVLKHSQSNFKPCGLFLADIHQGQSKLGVEKGPEVLLQSGFVEFLGEIGWLARVYAEKKLSQHEFDAYRFLYQIVEQHIQENDFNIFLGGDHSIAFSTLPVLLNRYPDLRVLWIDAHGDMNTTTSSPTGNIHGMPLSYALGAQEGTPFGFNWVFPHLDPSRLAIIGVRDLDVGEKELINKLNITCFTDLEIKKIGMKNVLKEVMFRLDPFGKYPLHLSFDLDAVDPTIACATGVPVGGGLDLRDIEELGTFFSNFEKLVSLELVELNPNLAKSQAELIDSIGVFYLLTNALLKNRLACSVQKSI